VEIAHVRVKDRKESLQKLSKNVGTVDREGFNVVKLRKRAVARGGNHIFLNRKWFGSSMLLVSSNFLCKKHFITEGKNGKAKV
jgi:hypothetical protein